MRTPIHYPPNTVNRKLKKSFRRLESQQYKYGLKTKITHVLRFNFIGKANKTLGSSFNRVISSKAKINSLVEKKTVQSEGRRAIYTFNVLVYIIVTRTYHARPVGLYIVALV